jgi:hypothetical protein
MSRDAVSRLLTKYVGLAGTSCPSLKAADRGMSQWGGILLGLILGPPGLAVVFLMPDRA